MEFRNLSILMNKIGKSSSKVCLHFLIELLFQKHGKCGQETETAESSNNFYILHWHCRNLKWMHDSHICLEAMFFFSLVEFGSNVLSVFGRFDLPAAKSGWYLASALRDTLKPRPISIGC